MRRRSAERSVVVAGAGPVGLLTAALIASDPRASYIKVRILDARSAPPWRPERTDLRVYALSRASQRLLDRLGLWSEVAARRACPYRTMHVWQGDPAAASLTFESAEIGEPDLGHIVEDSLLRDRLLARLGADPKVEITLGAAVASVRTEPGRTAVTTAAGETIRADLIVGADGSASPIRAALGIPTIERDYGQHAVVTHVETEKPHAQRALQRFLPGGPLAFLPLVDGRSSIVWSLPSSEAARLTACPDEEFVAALTEASGGVLGTLGPIDARASFALRMLHATAYCRAGAVLVGDAAHAVHPLAGQGMNLGFLDAAHLADVVAEALDAGQHPCDGRVLRRYERRRKGHNLAMLAALDGFDRLFRLPEWTSPARAAGMRAVDGAEPLKAALMRRALGLDDRLARSNYDRFMV